MFKGPDYLKMTSVQVHFHRTDTMGLALRSQSLSMWALQWGSKRPGVRKGLFYSTLFDPAFLVSIKKEANASCFRAS
jgi:hypothetical protein